jgi:phage-related protein
MGSSWRSHVSQDPSQPNQPGLGLRSCLRAADEGAQRAGAFPADARRELGHQLQRVQLRKVATDWRPFAAIGAGVFEIRIHSVLEYRMIVISKFREAIYVLHVFVRRTPRTSRRDVDLVRQRYGVLLRERGQK